MKICTYSTRTPLGKIKRLGILTEKNTIIDPNLCWRLWYKQEGRYNCEERANLKFPTKLSWLLRQSDAPILELQEAMDLYDRLATKGIVQSEDGARLERYLTADVRLECPMDFIPTYRDFFTHEKHVKVGFSKRNEEVPEAWYEMPVYYKGATTGFIGPEDEILWPSYTDKLDYELELGLVIGREGSNISAKNALSHIFGFTILNDISARDIQKKEMSVRLGPSKGKDFCSVIGPVITTADEFKGVSPHLAMEARINGEIWSQGNSSEAHYSWEEIIEHTSKDEWLLPGDLMGSGTVGSGCGLELDKWIKSHDVIELEVEKIGILRNRVGPKQQR